TLTLDDVLSRRLQTQVYLRGMAYTPKQARQMIIHGHIAVNGRKVRVPAYMVKKNEENAIAIVDTSPLAEDMHPMRPKAQETMEQRVAETAEEA
ncbi:MAG: 30S ribosomal protein S4, partial [Thermoplasmatota archaeon]